MMRPGQALLMVASFLILSVIVPEAVPARLLLSALAEPHSEQITKNQKQKRGQVPSDQPPSNQPPSNQPPSNQIEFMLNKADELDRKDEPGNGLKFCNRILQISPNTIKAHAIKASCLIDLKKMPEAWASLQNALKISGDQSWTYLVMGKWHQRKGDTAASIEDFRKSIAQNGRLPESYHALALACEKAKRMDEALAAYDGMIKINPLVAKSYEFRGDFFRKYKRYKEAEKDYSTLLGMTPKNIEVRSKRALIYYELGLYQQSLSDYLLVTRQNPFDEESLASQAEVRLALQQYKEGVLDATRAIELDSDDGRAYYVRGKNLEKLGRADEAAADIKKGASLGYSGQGLKQHPLID